MKSTREYQRWMFQCHAHLVVGNAPESHQRQQLQAPLEGNPHSNRQRNGDGPMTTRWTAVRAVAQQFVDLA
jgi:hypothetical protein